MRRFDNHDQYIRLARQRCNAAILNRNVKDICSFFTSDYHVVTGRGVQSHGIEEQLHRWTKAFQKDPIMLYRRRTREIRFNDQLDIAEELGSWVGKYSLNQNTTLVAGVYSAEWQLQIDGSWLVQAEIFTTLRSKYYNQGKS